MVLALVGLRPGAALAEDQPADTNYNGTYIVVTPGANNVASKQFLQVGEEYIPLKFKRETKLLPGQPAHIRGHKRHGTLEVTAEAEAGPAPTTTAPTATSSASLTLDRVLVMLVTWTVPDAMTPAAAAAQVFDRGTAFYDEVSYGRMGLTGSVTNWLTIARPSSCEDVYTIKSRAQSAARKAGFTPSAFDKLLFYFPSDARCSWSGMAEMVGRNSWINGELNDLVVFHELGHNYGLYHSHSYRCVSGETNVVLGGTCTTDEYGDHWDTMGHRSRYGAGHYNAAQKSVLGWLGTRLQTVTEPGTYMIQPYELRSDGIAALKVIGSDRTYYMEYRQPLGFDGFMSAWPGAVNGVQVRMPNSGAGSWLLDMTPSTDTFDDSALPVGQSWTDPSGMSVTVVSADAWAATVQIVLGEAAPATTTSTSTSSTSTSSTSTSTTIAASRSVIVTAPNGDEQWSLGQPNTITWSGTNIAGTGVTIVLLKDGSPYSTLAKATTGADGHGSYVWTPPIDLPRGTGYKIRVTVDGSSPVIRDTSDARFSLVT